MTNRHTSTDIPERPRVNKRSLHRNDSHHTHKPEHGDPPTSEGPASGVADVMETTARMWEHQDGHPGNRHRLFSAIADAFNVTTVLYPGSFVDIASSFVFDSVTYVDIDAQAARFFKDAPAVNRIIAERRTPATASEWRFIHADYTDELDLPEGHFDLLVSLYAGFVSEHCTRYLRPGGLLLVNPSHGDVAVASIDRRYRFVAVVNSRSGAYTIGHENLDSYLKPKRHVTIDIESIHLSGRGIGYTKSPFAYVFQLDDK